MSTNWPQIDLEFIPFEKNSLQALPCPFFVETDDASHGQIPSPPQQKCFCPVSGTDCTEGTGEKCDQWKFFCEHNSKDAAWALVLKKSRLLTIESMCFFETVA